MKLISNTSLFNKIQLSVILSIVILLPFTRKFIPLLIGFWALIWVLQNKWKEKWNNLKSSGVFFLLIIFYLFHAAGLLYTENMPEGLFDMEVKFSLLLFPVLIFSDKIFFRENQSLIFCAFVLGNIIAALSTFIFNIYWSLRYDVDYFYYSNFTLFLHPSYASLYAIFSICLIIYFLMNFKQELHKNFLWNIFSKKWLAVLFTLLLLAYVINLGSRAGIVAVIIITGLIISYYLIHYKKIFLLFVFWAVIFLGSIYILNKFPRFVPVIEFLKTPSDSINPDSRENVVVRYFLIKESMEITKENFLFGVGTGDIKKELIKRYKEKNISLAIEENLNPHNQFLESFATLGIPGIISLLLLVFVTLYKGIKEKSILLISFSLLITINFLFESMLNTQAGVIFFAFFNTLLLISEKNNSHSFSING